jgi:hypothetical protein
MLGKVLFSVTMALDGFIAHATSASPAAARRSWST